MRTLFLGLLVLLIPRMAYCEPAWRFTAAGAFPGRPAISVDGVVYAPSDDRHLYAFSESNGEQKWRAYLGDRPNGAIAISVDGSVLVGTRRRSLIAVNPKGIVIWRISLPANIVGDPAVSAAGTIYLSLDDGTLTAISHRGKIRYVASASGMRSAATGPSIARDGSVLFPSLDRNLYSFDLEGDISWNVVLAGVPTQVCIDTNDFIYVGTDYGTVVAITPNGRVLWDHLESAPFTSPVCVTDGVIASTSAGVVMKLDTNGLVVWRYNVGESLLGIIAVDKRETVLLETVNGELVRVDSGGILGDSVELQAGSSGAVLSKSGYIVAGSTNWKISGFTAGTTPAEGWSLAGYDSTHIGSMDSGDTAQRVIEKYSQTSEYIYLDSILANGSYSMLSTATHYLRDSIESSTLGPGFRSARRFLEKIASHGLLRVELNVGRPANDYPDIRASAIKLFPDVADVWSNRFLASLISYEHDTYALSAAMRAVGEIGSDSTGAATRAIAAVIMNDPDRIRREESLGFAAIHAMNGIIAYHGEPTDPSGLSMLLAMFRADYSRELREFTLAAIRSIRYY